MSEITLYQAADGSIEVRLEQETVWLSQAQMVMLFGRDQSVISRHIGNLFKEGELERESNMQKMHIANSDKPVDFLNRNGRLLDAADQPVINDIGLAALTLLVAESDPTHKETMIRLIMNMLATGTSQ
jgi:hypothetical protein